MRQKGFTLIELVVVIVILGILAATAVPKFIDISDDAKNSVLDGVKASIEGAMALVHGKSVVAGNQNEETATITLSNGADIDITYGYPLVPPPFPPNAVDDYWNELLNLSDDFSFRAAANGDLIIYFTEDGVASLTDDPCTVIYSPPENAGEKPQPFVNECE